MSIPVDLTIANPDPALKFTTLTDLVALLRLLLTGQIDLDLNFYVLGSVTPSVDDQDKVWFRLDSGVNGRPVGTYTFYNGLWVRVAPDPAHYFSFFTGDPTGLFDSTGLGLAGPGPVALDFFGWAIANGSNTTAINWKDRMPIAANLDDPSLGWDTGVNAWKTTASGSAVAVGGVNAITLDDTTTYRRANAGKTATLWTASGAAVDNTNGLWGQPDVAIQPSFDVVPVDAGNLTPPAIPTLPPYIACAIIQWIGYP